LDGTEERLFANPYDQSNKKTQTHLPVKHYIQVEKYILL